MANPLEDAEHDGNMDENETVLPCFMEEGGALRESRLEKRELWGKGRKSFVRGLLDENGYSEGMGSPYVSCLYDARSVYQSGMCQTASELEEKVLTPVMELAQVLRGDTISTEDQSLSKVPVICLPHGLCTDGGYAMLSGSYALVTDGTSYRILNPLRGLTLDPIGLSYLLPRLGIEFNQTSIQPHAWGCALLLSLMGYEAQPSDLVSTGLATHYIGPPYKLNMLERGLMDIHSYDGQRLKRNPRKFYGQEDQVHRDVNEEYRNVAVGNLIQSISEYDAAGADEYGCFLSNELDEESQLFLKEKDPSLRMSDERIQMYGEVVSPLVNWSATFSSVWEEKSVEGIMERLREIAAGKAEYAGKSGCEEDVAVADMAGYFVSCMEQRSPLALEVTYNLLCEGIGEEETWRSCAEREKRAQLNLMMQKDGDFARWAKSGEGVGLTSMEGKASLIREQEGVFCGWKHASVKDVTEDEVKEILG